MTSFLTTVSSFMWGHFMFKAPLCPYLCVCFFYVSYFSSPKYIYIYICVCVYIYIPRIYVCICRSQWPRGLRRWSAAARLPRSWVRIPPGAWMLVCCECWCVVRWRSLRRADHSSRGVLPTVVRRCVSSRNLKN